MKTIVITRFRPDKPAGGAALRNWQNIQALAKLGPVDVISIGEEEASGEVGPVRHWIGFSHQKLLKRSTVAGKLRSKLWRWRPGVHPSFAAYFHAEVVRRLRKQISTEKYDVAVIEELSLAHYHPILAEGGCRVVYDAHNVEIKLRREIAEGGRQDSRLLRRLHAEEKKIIEHAALIWTCSELDSEIIRGTFSGSLNLAVVPNGVDVETYQQAIAAEEHADWSSHPLTLVYPASFSYRPNIDAALAIIQQLAPALRALGHEAQIFLVGRDPHPSMRKAAADNPSIHITGPVESILPYLSRPCVVALPIMLGSGTRLKILEAFACSRPVVSTTKGCEGIEAIDGEHILIRDDIKAMAEGIACVWRDQTLRRKLCSSALALVREKYSWDVAAAQIARSLRQSTP